MGREPRRAGFRPTQRNPQELVDALRELATETGEPRARARDRRPMRARPNAEAVTAAHPAEAVTAAHPAEAVTAAHLAEALRAAGAPPVAELTAVAASTTVGEPTAGETPPPVAYEPVPDRPAALAPEPTPVPLRAPPAPLAIDPLTGSRGPAGSRLRAVGRAGWLAPGLRLGLSAAAAILVLLLVAWTLLGPSQPSSRTAAVATPASTTIPAPAANPARHRVARGARRRHTTRGHRVRRTAAHRAARHRARRHRARRR
jgi:hypothetical protein